MEFKCFYGICVLRIISSRFGPFGLINLIRLKIKRNPKVCKLQLYLMFWNYKNLWIKALLVVPYLSNDLSWQLTSFEFGVMCVKLWAILERRSFGGRGKFCFLLYETLGLGMKITSRGSPKEQVDELIYVEMRSTWLAIIWSSCLDFGIVVLIAILINISRNVISFSLLFEWRLETTIYPLGVEFIKVKENGQK